MYSNYFPLHEVHARLPRDKNELQTPPVFGADKTRLQHPVAGSSNEAVGGSPRYQIPCRSAHERPPDPAIRRRKRPLAIEKTEFRS